MRACHSIVTITLDARGLPLWTFVFILALTTLRGTSFWSKLPFGALSSWVSSIWVSSFCEVLASYLVSDTLSFSSSRVSSISSAFFSLILNSSSYSDLYLISYCRCTSYISFSILSASSFWSLSISILSTSLASLSASYIILSSSSFFFLSFSICLIRCFSLNSNTSLTCYYYRISYCLANSFCSF